MKREAVIRLTAGVVIVAGLFLLAYTLYSGARGSLVLRVFKDGQRPWVYDVYALGLVLPVPFHVIAIGLLLKRKWLSPFWTRAAWAAVVLSGCWLGAALAVRYAVI